VPVVLCYLLYCWLLWLKHLRRLNNFNSYLAILSAVDSAPVRRLEWPKPNVEVCMKFTGLDTCSGFDNDAVGSGNVYCHTNVNRSLSLVAIFSRLKGYITAVGWKRHSCPIFGFWPLFPIENAFKKVPSGDQPAAQKLHHRMILIFTRDSWRSKGVSYSSGFLLQLLVGELWTPKLAQIFAYSKWLYPHRMVYYTARQISTKDV